MLVSCTSLKVLPAAVPSPAKRTPAVGRARTARLCGGGATIGAPITGPITLPDRTSGAVGSSASMLGYR